MAKREKPEIREITDIVANKADKVALHGFLDEAVRCKLKIADEQESIKLIREEALKQVGLDPKLFGSLVNIAYKNNYLETQSEIHSLDSAIELLFSNDGV